MGIFDEMAARYDTPERARVADIIAAEIRSKVKNGAQKSALDYGCGTGLVGLQLAGDFRDILYVDASPQMVEVMRAKIERAGLHNATALCADFAAELPQGLGADCIFMAQVLLHIPDTQRILSQLYTLLNPGGQLLVVDFDKDEGIVSDKVHNGFVQADLIALAKQTGFATATAEIFYQGSRLFMGRDASMFILDATKAAV